MRWEPAVPPRALEPGLVHVWRFRLDHPGDQDGARFLLSEAERRRADRYRSELARRNFAVSRAAVRRILGAYWGVAPELLSLQAGRWGKISVPPGPSGGQLEFSVSHSGDLGLLAVAAETRVGVDVQRHEPGIDLVSVTLNAFSPGERALWSALPEERRQSAFFDTWTRKEAFLKGLGRGLGFGLQRFDVSFDEPAFLDGVDAGPGTGEWSIRQLEVGTGYSAALAAERSGINVDAMELQPATPARHNPGPSRRPES